MKKLFALISPSLLLLACNNPTKTVTTVSHIDISYPVTKKDSIMRDTFFNTVVADPYRWLENDTSVETSTWVKEQNK